LEEDGSLVLECDIWIAVEDQRVWYPKKLMHNETLAGIYQDGSSETADTVFSVQGTTFSVHRIILSGSCQKLYEIAQDSSDGTTISIDSAGADAFKAILEYVYSVKTPDIGTKDEAMELLVASDRFECISLKLYVESVMVDRFLSAESAAEFWVFADAHSCALLKEAAADVFVKDIKALKNSESWPCIRKSERLLDEVVDILANAQDGALSSVIKTLKNSEAWPCIRKSERLLDELMDILVNAQDGAIDAGGNLLSVIKTLKS